MTSFAVIEARRHMCGKMSRMLRAAHQSAAIRMGLDAHRGLRDVYDQSYYRKALLIDGHLSALGGVMGSALSPSGFIWLALTDRATLYPRIIVKEARRQLAEIMLTKLELRTTIIDGDAAAKRLVCFLGFHVTDGGEGAAACTRYGRRRLIDFIDREPDLRVAQGDGAAIVLRYHAADYAGGP